MTALRWLSILYHSILVQRAREWFRTFSGDLISFEEKNFDFRQALHWNTNAFVIEVEAIQLQIVTKMQVSCVLVNDEKHV